MKTRYYFDSRISSLAGLNRMLMSERFRGSKFYIVLDEYSYTNCLPQLISKVSALEEAEFFEVPVGEEAKSIEVATQLWSAMLESGADRNSVIVNLGGGCVSDLGGFVAAGFKRGIRYINVPTTLIGMIDASIGGKTAVNIENAKNQVGFFHHPDAVCICPDFLDTLNDAFLESGIFEMAKTLLLCDGEAFFSLIDSVVGCSIIPLDKVKGLIKQCVEFKRSVVENDPNEKSVRKILNFGHTFGHAIESFLMERELNIPHGAAVGIGMKCELYLSVKKLGMSDKALKAMSEMLNFFVAVPKFSLKEAEAILQYMRKDKKNSNGLILCVLLQDIAVPVIDVAIDENEVRDTLLQIGKF